MCALTQHFDSHVSRAPVFVGVVVAFVPLKIYGKILNLVGVSVSKQQLNGEEKLMFECLGARVRRHC